MCTQSLSYSSYALAPAGAPGKMEAEVKAAQKQLVKLTGGAVDEALGGKVGDWIEGGITVPLAGKALTVQKMIRFRVNSNAYGGRDVHAQIGWKVTINSSIAPISEHITPSLPWMLYRRNYYRWSKST